MHLFIFKSEYIDYFYDAELYFIIWNAVGKSSKAKIYK